MLADVSTMATVAPQLGARPDDTQACSRQEPDEHEQRQGPEGLVRQPTEYAPQDQADGVEHPDTRIDHRSGVAFRAWAGLCFPLPEPLILDRSTWGSLLAVQQHLSARDHDIQATKHACNAATPGGLFCLRLGRLKVSRFDPGQLTLSLGQRFVALLHLGPSAPYLCLGVRSWASAGGAGPSAASLPPEGYRDRDGWAGWHWCHPSTRRRLAPHWPSGRWTR